jgi:hypothetical protein
MSFRTGNGGISLQSQHMEAEIGVSQVQSQSELQNKILSQKKSVSQKRIS